MNTIISMLERSSRLSGWKINTHKKESYELFFVKGKLETLRRTDTCDKTVTVYVAHGEFLGDAEFIVYPSTTEEQLAALIGEAADRAAMICNQPYSLPGAETGDYRVDSNFRSFDPAELAARIAETVFSAADLPCGSLNSLEVFVNRHTDTVCNSRGLRKSQTRYDAMVEAIPTYNGENQSVELYELIRMGNLDEAALAKRIAGKMAEVRARNEAAVPASPPNCPVILNIQELSELFANFRWDLHYSSVYSRSNLYHKGDAIQKDPTGDPITITLAGQAEGCVHSAKFDGDGLSLGSIRLVENGTVQNYYGSNRFGQYLGEEPTGELRCMILEPGTAKDEDFHNVENLEIVSMSGLQVDLYTNYIGGEIRLAYHRTEDRCVPITGISFSGKLDEVLSSIRLSRNTAVCGSYSGPEKAILRNVSIF